MISNPKLPPKKGYREVVDLYGNSSYVRTQKQIEKEELQKENNLLKAQVQALSDRNEFVEDCIAEMAMKVYE